MNFRNLHYNEIDTVSSSISSAVTECFYTKMHKIISSLLEVKHCMHWERKCKFTSSLAFYLSLYVMLNSSLRTLYSRHSIQTSLMFFHIWTGGKHCHHSTNSANKGIDSNNTYPFENWLKSCGIFSRNFKFAVRCICMFLFAKTMASVHAFTRIGLKWICILQPLCSLQLWTQWNLCIYTCTLGCLFNILFSISTCTIRSDNVKTEYSKSLQFRNVYGTTYSEFNVRSLKFGFRFSCWLPPATTPKNLNSFLRY